MADIYISNGSASEVVVKHTNAAGVERAAPILKIDPDRGSFLRILNRVTRGDEVGIPVYMRLRDANRDPFPTNTLVNFELERGGDRFAKTP